MPEIIVFLIALIATLRGADWLGRASISWGKSLNLPHFVIGATFVSVATTLPEITFATFAGSLNHEPQLALGAVLGSALINSGLLLGLYFFLFKKRPELGYFSRAINIFIIISILLLVVSATSYFGDLISLLLLTLGGLFIFLEFIIGKKSQNLIERFESRFEGLISLFNFSNKKAPLLEFVFGFIFLIVGINFMISSSLFIASTFQLDELFVTFTLVAVGTSLPELITMITSLKKGQESIAIGNLIGASVINLTIGVGIATFINSTTLNFPINLIIFIPLTLIGIIGLLSLFRKLSLSLTGVVLVMLTFICLISFSIYEIF